MRVLFSCVAENTVEWCSRVETLALSIRTFGGQLSNSPIVANFVDGVEPAFVRRLDALHVEPRVVPRVDPRSPYANKLRMFELVRSHEFDVLVGLDCDVVVVGDISGELSTSEVGAKPADINVLTRRQWDRLFDRLGISPPADRVVATTSGESMYPYYNSGVVAVPWALCDRLHERWSAYVADILALYETSDPIVPAHWRFYLDQFALACALVDERLPVRPFDIRMNFPMHLEVHQAALTGHADPLIIHYHRNTDGQGFLLRGHSRVADRAAEAFNRARADHLNLRYSGLRRRSLRRRTRQAAVVGIKKLLSPG